MPVISAHFLVVRAVVVFCSPQRDDDVTGLRASVPGALGAGQRAERQCCRSLLCMFPRPLPDLDQQNDQEDDDEDEDDAARPDGREESRLRAKDALVRNSLVLVDATCLGTKGNG